MRILVTGAAGFIGGHLCERLLADGHAVVAMDNLSTGSLSNLEFCRAYGRAFTFINHDVCYENLPIYDLDAIMHLASPASPADYMRLPLETLLVGSQGTKRMADLALLNKQCRVVFTSTSEIYGDPLVHPQPESYWGHVNSIGPRSVYDEAKRYAEALLMAYRRTHGLDVRIARLFNTYGPRMRPHDGRVISTFIRQAHAHEALTIFGSGLQTRSFCYVTDTVDALVKMLHCDSISSPINIGNPQAITIIEIAHLVRDLLCSTSNIVHRDLPEDDPRQREPIITRAIEILKWKPTISLRDGILKMIDHQLC